MAECHRCGRPSGDAGCHPGRASGSPGCRTLTPPARSPMVRSHTRDGQATYYTIQVIRPSCADWDVVGVFRERARAMACWREMRGRHGRVGR